MPFENHGQEALPPTDLGGRHPKGIGARVLLTSVFGPGTPLYAEMLAQKRMLPGIDVAEMHGQDKFNFRHTAISREDSKPWLDWAFRRDFDRNGPSLFRICRTTLEGWRRHKDHPDERIRQRFTWEALVAHCFQQHALGNAAAPDEHQSGYQRYNRISAPGYRLRVRSAQSPG